MFSDIFFYTLQFLFCVSVQGRSETLPGPLLTSKMKSFATVVNGQELLTIVAKLSLLDIYKVTGCTSEDCSEFL